MAQTERNGVLYETDRRHLRYGQHCEFALSDGTTIEGVACDSCVLTGALFGPNRKDVCWSKVIGFRSIHSEQGKRSWESQNNG